jgi:hypothetical protein
MENNKPFTQNMRGGLPTTPVKTYRGLLACLEQMNDEQLDSTITVEDGTISECFAAELRIVDSEHDSLDENHPVLYLGVGSFIEPE